MLLSHLRNKDSEHNQILIKAFLPNSRAQMHADDLLHLRLVLARPGKEPLVIPNLPPVAAVRFNPTAQGTAPAWQVILHVFFSNHTDGMLLARAYAASRLPIKKDFEQTTVVLSGKIVIASALRIESFNESPDGAGLKKYIAKHPNNKLLANGMDLARSILTINP